MLVIQSAHLMQPKYLDTLVTFSRNVIVCEKAEPYAICHECLRPNWEATTQCTHQPVLQRWCNQSKGNSAGQDRTLSILSGLWKDQGWSLKSKLYCTRRVLMQQAIQHQASTACHPDFPDKLIIVGPEQGGLILNQTVSATQPDNPAVSMSPYILMLLCGVCFAFVSLPAGDLSVPIPEE